MFRRLFSNGKMSARERILAALQGQAVDRIPFVPLIDTYTVLDMPAHIQQEIQTASSEGYWQGMLQAIRKIGCDVMLRHVDVLQPSGGTPHLGGLGRFELPIHTHSRLDGSLLIETLETPIGTLDATWGFTDRHGWIPHPLKHLVNNYEELKIFDYALDHLNMEPPETDFENFLTADRAVGDDGIATTSILNTPLMHLIETCWGLENTYFLLHDHPQEVESILDKLHRAQKLIVEQVATSPAKVVIEYENTSSTLLSPKVFRRYCLPHLNEYADILRSKGKIFLVHMCGKLSAFVDDLAAARFDGIAAISPEPTGNLTLDEAADRLRDKVVMGGIDANTFIGTDLHQLETQIVQLIEKIKPYRGVLLGSADTAPRGTPLENFQLIQHLVNTVGSYSKRAVASYHPGDFADSLLTTAGKRGETGGTELEEEGKVDMLQVMQELTRRLDGKRPEVSGVIQFNITDDTIYRLFIEQGKCRLDISEGEADASMTASSKHLLALFSGKLKPMSAFMTRKIKFEGNLQLLGVLAAAE